MKIQLRKTMNEFQISEDEEKDSPGSSFLKTEHSSGDPATGGPSHAIDTQVGVTAEEWEDMARGSSSGFKNKDQEPEKEKIKVKPKPRILSVKNSRSENNCSFETNDHFKPSPRPRSMLKKNSPREEGERQNEEAAFGEELESVPSSPPRPNRTWWEAEEKALPENLDPEDPELSVSPPLKESSEDSFSPGPEEQAPVADLNEEVTENYSSLELNENEENSLLTDSFTTTHEKSEESQGTAGDLAGEKATPSVDDNVMAHMGDGTTADMGDDLAAIEGDDTMADMGDDLTAAKGDDVTAAVGNVTADVGDNVTADAGDDSTADVGDDFTATAGDDSTADAGPFKSQSIVMPTHATESAKNTVEDGSVENKNPNGGRAASASGRLMTSEYLKKSCCVRRTPPKTTSSHYLGTLKVLDQKPSQKHSTEPGRADSVRAAVYQEWLEKKNVYSREMQRMKRIENENLRMENEQKRAAKREAALASFEAWKAMKEKEARAAATKKRLEDQGRKKAEDDTAARRGEALQAFEKWKEKKMEYLKEKTKKEKECERAKKQSEEEALAEKRRDNHTAIEKWNEKKEAFFKQKEKEKRNEKRKEALKRAEKRDRDKQALDEYERWLENKERQRRTERRQKKRHSCLGNEARAPWSPPGRAVLSPVF